MDVAATRDRLKAAPLMQVAGRIRQARVDADLSHDRLGEKVGTSRQHLISLEKGKHRPRLEMLTRIADATGREVEWFLSPEGAPFRNGVAA